MTERRAGWSGGTGTNSGDTGRRSSGSSGGSSDGGGGGGGWNEGAHHYHWRGWYRQMTGQQIVEQIGIICVVWCEDTAIVTHQNRSTRRIKEGTRIHYITHVQRSCDG